MMTSGALQSGMGQFYGTEQYYGYGFNPLFKYTDGFKWFLEAGECFWLLDILATEFFAKAKYWTNKEGDNFFVVEVESKDSKAVIRGRTYDQHGDEAVMFEKNIDFTDLPEGTYKFYYTSGVMMVKSEY